MTPGLLLAVLAIAAATAACMLLIHELHIRALNTHVSNLVTGVASGRSSPVRRDLIGWLSALGTRYRRFYSAEDLEELRTVVQASGFNPHRTLSIWIGVKIVSIASFPIVAVFLGEFFGKPLGSLLMFALIGVVIGIMGPRLILSLLKRRFSATVRRGTPNAIDLLVVCSEAGMGLESAVERVAEEMNRSNPAVAQVLYGLLDDLRVLPDRRAAFEKLGSRSDAMRTFGAMLSQSLQYGTPLGKALRAIADELRRESLVKLEERAHKLGAQLTIPMVLFIFPAMFVILGASPFLHLVRAFSSH
jgi:tight adherence protein C